MESHSYFWTILLLAILLISMLIIILFIIINVCISKRAARYHTQTQTQTKSQTNHYTETKFKNEENQVFQKNFESEKPPLPPRDQFQSMDYVDQGYVEPLPDYVVVEGSTPAEPQQPFTLQYATVETKSLDSVNDTEDYDDVEMPVNSDSEDYDDVG